MASTTVIVISGDHRLCSCCSAWALKAPPLPVMAACWLLSCGSKDLPFLCSLPWSRPQRFSELLVSMALPFPSGCQPADRLLLLQFSSWLANLLSWKDPTYPPTQNKQTKPQRSPDEKCFYWSWYWNTREGSQDSRGHSQSMREQNSPIPFYLLCIQRKINNTVLTIRT